MKFYVWYDDSYKYESECFYMYSYRSTIHDIIKEIIACEGPVSKNNILKHVISIFGMTRAGIKVNEIFDECVFDFKITMSRNTIFFWQNNQEPNKYLEYRVPQNTLDKRSLNDICDEEIANAIKNILENALSISKEDLYRSIAKMFGYSKIGTSMPEIIDSGISYAKEKGFIENKDDRIFYIE